MRLVRVVLFVRHSLVIARSQIVLVQVAHRVVQRFSAHLVVLHKLEFFLVLSQVSVCIEVAHLVDFVLFVLQVIVRISVHLESTLQTSLNA